MTVASHTRIPTCADQDCKGRSTCNEDTPKNLLGKLTWAEACGEHLCLNNQDCIHLCSGAASKTIASARHAGVNTLPRDTTGHRRPPVNEQICRFTAEHPHFCERARRRPARGSRASGADLAASSRCRGSGQPRTRRIRRWPASESADPLRSG